MKYQENDNFVIFPSRPEQSPLRKVAAMDKSSKPSAAMRSIQLLTLSVIFALTGCLSLAPDYQRPAAPVPQQFSLSQNKLVTATAGYQETGWRTFFVDPQVKSLISTALAQRQSLADQIAAQQRYLASLNITLQRATALYRHGAVSYIEVLSAQRDIFTTRQTLLELNYSRQANEITLFTALGGGWME